MSTVFFVVLFFSTFFLSSTIEVGVVVALFTTVLGFMAKLEGAGASCLTAAGDAARDAAGDATGAVFFSASCLATAEVVVGTAALSASIFLRICSRI